MELNEVVRGAFERAFPGEVFSFVRVLPATDPKFGDYQCNDALKLAKTLKRNPREVGAAVAGQLGGIDVFEKVEVAGPGFLNLTVSPGWLGGRLAELASRPSCGIPQVGGGKTVVIDYSSPNAAKQMHIGHIRSTVIGSAIDRIFRSLGYRVVADNHLEWEFCLLGEYSLQGALDEHLVIPSPYQYAYKCHVITSVSERLGEAATSNSSGGMPQASTWTIASLDGMFSSLWTSVSTSGETDQCRMQWAIPW